MLSTILFDHVCKQYGKDNPVVKDFCLEVLDREFVVFVGPSGCGKSTTLRMIAGLEEISQGGIYINHVKVNQLPPKDRDIAMVFQNYALYPNLSVYENIAFGLRLRKQPKHEIDLAVKRAARVLEIDALLGRKPRDLSGGQRQRVALGRAIVRNPQVFLMDEPLSNLDAKLRVSMRSELIRLQKQLGVTTIYVTHDQTEAMTMASRIVVMKNGVVQQVDTPERVYNQPANTFVAGFIGSPPMNFMEGRLLEQDGGGLEFHTNRFALPLPSAMGRALAQRHYNGKSVILGIRPEHIAVEEDSLGEDTDIGSRVTGLHRFSELMGADRYLHLDIGTGGTLVARTAPHRHFADDEKVKLIFGLNRSIVFDRTDGTRILDA